MGTNCAPLLADIFLYSHEADFIQSLLSTGKKHLASRFNLTYMYIDDVLSINNPEFENYLGQMYPVNLRSRTPQRAPLLLLTKIYYCRLGGMWSIPLTNVKWHSDPWPTVTSQPIGLSTNFMTLIPSLTLTDYEWFPWSICNGYGMPAGNAYPSGHLVPSPIVGLDWSPILETRVLELAMYLLDYSPRIPLGTFSILLNKVKPKGMV